MQSNLLLLNMLRVLELLRHRWSREQAIEFMTNYTASAPGSAANEIDRYITWPGQACAYKVGETKIKDLRKSAETELGIVYLNSL